MAFVIRFRSLASVLGFRLGTVAVRLGSVCFSMLMSCLCLHAAARCCELLSLSLFARIKELLEMAASWVVFRCSNHCTEASSASNTIN